MHPNKLGLFIRAIVAGDTEFRTFQGDDGKKSHSYVTPVAANGHFGEAVQRVSSESEMNDRRGNPVRRYKAGDIFEGEIEPSFDKDFKRVVARWTVTTPRDLSAATPRAVAPAAAKV